MRVTWSKIIPGFLLLVCWLESSEAALLGAGRTLIVLRQECQNAAPARTSTDPCDAESLHRTNALELLVRGQLRSKFDQMVVWKLPLNLESMEKARQTLNRVSARGPVELWVLPEGDGSRVAQGVAHWLSQPGMRIERLVWSGPSLPSFGGVPWVEEVVEVPADSRVARAGWVEFVQGLKSETAPALSEREALWKRAARKVRGQRASDRVVGGLVPWVVPGEQLEGGVVSGASLREGWKFYEAAFPHPLEGVSGDLDEVGPQAWVDGDGLKLLTSQVERYLGPIGRRMLAGVMGVRLVSREDGFKVSIHSRVNQEIVWDQPEDLVGLKGLWKGFTLPRILKARISLSQGVLWVNASQEAQPFRMNLSIQGFPLGVEFRAAGIDLDTGEYRVEAGFLGGAVRLVGRGRLFSKQWDGIDFWESVRRSVGDWTVTPSIFEESAGPDFPGDFSLSDASDGRIQR